jgi:hypothetical protein
MASEAEAAADLPRDEVAYEIGSVRFAYPFPWLEDDTPAVLDRQRREDADKVSTHTACPYFGRLTGRWARSVAAGACLGAAPPRRTLVSEGCPGRGGPTGSWWATHKPALRVCSSIRRRSIRRTLPRSTSYRSSPEGGVVASGLKDGIPRDGLRAPRATRPARASALLARLWVTGRPGRDLHRPRPDYGATPAETSGTVSPIPLCAGAAGSHTRTQSVGSHDARMWSLPRLSAEARSEAAQPPSRATDTRITSARIGSTECYLV